MSVSLDTSPSLLKDLATASNSSAWERFLRLYGPLLVRWNKHWGLQQADAEDVAQEIAAHVFGSIDQFEHRHAGSFRAWLKAIAFNKIRHLRDRKARRTEHSLEAVGPLVACHGRDWGNGYAEDIFSRSLELIRKEFSPNTWEVFQRVHFAGENPMSVGLGHGMSRNAVYLACGRVLGRLKEALEGLLEDEAL